MNKALIVIDAQEDFTRGALRNEEAIQALPVIRDVVKFMCKNSDYMVTYTMDTHTDAYALTQEGRNLPVKHCVKNTDGWKICGEVVPQGPSKALVIEKPTFGNLNWHGFFNNADEIWLCGFCTDICVSANFQILKATYPETPIVVIEDACAGVTPELHQAALKVMNSCQGRIVKWKDLKRENEAEL